MQLDYVQAAGFDDPVTWGAGAAPNYVQAEEFVDHQPWTFCNLGCSYSPTMSRQQDLLTTSPGHSVTWGADANCAFPQWLVRSLQSPPECR